MGHSLATNGPAIDQVAPRSAVHQLRNRVAVVDQKNVGLIEIRGAVVGSRSERIVPGEKQSQAALLVKRMRPGVRRGELQAVGHALVDLELQSIEVRDALRLIRHRVHVVAGIGYANGCIARVFVGRDRLGIQEQRTGTPVGSGLPVHHIRRRGDEWLVEGNGQHQMGTVIADVTDLEHPAVGGLKLKVEGPVLRVRQFVIDIVTAKQERAIKIAGRPASRITASSLLEVRQVGEEGCSRGWRRRWQSRAERLRERRALGDGDWLDERRRQRDAEWAVKSGPRARRQVAEYFAAVVVDTVPCTHGELRQRRPRDADAGRETPLVIFHERIADSWRGAGFVIPSDYQTRAGNYVGVRVAGEPGVLGQSRVCRSSTDGALHVTVFRRVKTCKLAVFFRERRVDIPTQPGGYREVFPHLKVVVNVGADRIGAIVTVRRTNELIAAVQGAFYKVLEGGEIKGIGIRVVIEDIELDVVPRRPDTQDVLSFHPTRGGSVFPLILEHAAIAKAGAGTKLQTSTDRRIRRGDVELRKSRRARQANAQRTWGKGLCGVGISSQAGETHMLFPCKVRGKHDGVRQGKHLAAGGKLLCESQQRTDRAKRIRGGIALNVISPGQAILGAHNIIDAGDPLVYGGLRIGALHDGIVA